jgi:hypothetical protein
MCAVLRLCPPCSGVLDTPTAVPFSRQMPHITMQALQHLESVHGLATYIYDICPQPNCSVVFRREISTEQNCPKCKTPRFDDNGNACKRLYYLGVADWLHSTMQNPDIVR